MAAVRAGEHVVVTMYGVSVADIVPFGGSRSPWVSSDEIRRICADFPADRGLLEVLAEVRRPMQ